MSSIIKSITSLIAKMSFSEKRTALQLLMNSIDAQLVDPLESSSIPEELKPVAVTTPVKAKKVKTPNAPKKAASPGVKAWNAFVKHCKNTHPELFKDTKKESERLVIVGSIREKDPQAYRVWVENWESAHVVSDAESIVLVEEPAEEVIVVQEPVKEVIVVQEPVKEVIVVQEPAEEVIVVQEPVKEVIVVQEPAEEVIPIDADLLHMTCQELRDTWAPMVGKRVGLKSSGKLSNKTYLREAIMFLRKEAKEAKPDIFEPSPSQGSVVTQKKLKSM